MVLESTVICVDNTEYSRNGDFTPSRFGVQQDVLQTLSRTKMNSHPENNVALLAAGGKKPKLINTLTPERNKLLTGFAKLTHDGEENNFSVSLRTAHLALKHRMSKNHRQRIIFMICSPLIETEQELIKLAKKLKKENVAVDIVNFGEDEKNVERLLKFIETLNGKNADPNTVNCHLVNVPSGSNVNDAVRNSPICGASQQSSSGIQGGVAQGMNLGGAGGADDWDDLENMDPDLALALRVSLEESRARQQQENSNAANAENVGNLEAIAEDSTEPSAGQVAAATTAAGAISNAQSTPTATSAAAANNNNNQEPNANEDMADDDAVLMQALQMSLQPDAAGGESEEAPPNEEVNLAGMTEEEQIEYALRMSMADAEKEDDKDMEE